MNERERFPEPSQGAGPGDPGSSNLSQWRQEADRLLAAGDQAIQRSLSGDSEAFLRANRQEGGQ